MASSSHALPECWQSTTVSATETVGQIGDLTVRHQRPGSLLRLALTLNNRTGTFSAFDMKPTTEPRWRRWPAPEGASIHVTPALPTTPLVLRLRFPLTVGPGMKARCFAAIPLWAKLQAKNDSQSVDLADVPTRVMSHAWWGTPQQGVMCYSLPGRDLFTPDPQPPDTTAICRLTISAEEKDDPVTVSLLRIPGEELSLYRHDGRWWTSDLAIHLRSDGDQEEKVSAAAPIDASQAIRITEPRVSPGGNAVGRFVRDPLAFIGR